MLGSARRAGRALWCGHARCPAQRAPAQLEHLEHRFGFCRRRRPLAERGRRCRRPVLRCCDRVGVEVSGKVARMLQMHLQAGGRMRVEAIAGSARHEWSIRTSLGPTAGAVLGTRADIGQGGPSGSSGHFAVSIYVSSLQCDEYDVHSDDEHGLPAGGGRCVCAYAEGDPAEHGSRRPASEYRM